MSDHIPDVTKMISDTPRTESFNCYDSGCDDPLHAWGAFSAELERELNAANERIPLLIAERDTARRQADQKYKLRKEFAELLGTDDVEQGVAVVREMQQRIKRLEEALESIREYWNRDNNERAMEDACWHAINTASEALEAKEAKP
jgi:predicted RNase H-like nuclease (RuvC/YqgF family)